MIMKDGDRWLEAVDMQPERCYELTPAQEALLQDLARGSLKLSLQREGDDERL